MHCAIYGSHINRQTHLIRANSYLKLFCPLTRWVIGSLVGIKNTKKELHTSHPKKRQKQKDRSHFCVLSWLFSQFSNKATALFFFFLKFL